MLVLIVRVVYLLRSVVVDTIGWVAPVLETKTSEESVIDDVF